MWFPSFIKSKKRKTRPFHLKVIINGQFVNSESELSECILLFYFLKQCNVSILYCRKEGFVVLTKPHLFVSASSSIAVGCCIFSLSLPDCSICFFHQMAMSLRKFPSPDRRISCHCHDADPLIISPISSLQGPQLLRRGSCCLLYIGPSRMLLTCLLVIKMLNIHRRWH